MFRALPLAQSKGHGWTRDLSAEAHHCFKRYQGVLRQPGFKTYDIMPHPGRTLKQVSGETPTPFGRIAAGFDLSTGLCTVSAPVGTTETSDKRALSPDTRNSPKRNATCYSNSDQTMSVTIGIKGRRDYQVALYFVDWSRNECRQAVEMMDAGTLNQVAPVKIVDDFSGGAYLIYKYNKSAKFRFNKVRGSLVTLSGVFFDPSTTTSASHHGEG